MVTRTSRSYDYNDALQEDLIAPTLGRRDLIFKENQDVAKERCHRSSGTFFDFLRTENMNSRLIHHSPK